MRKRTQLLKMFPAGTITAEEASEALRLCQGDLEQAKAALMAETSKTAATKEKSAAAARADRDDNGDIKTKKDKNNNDNNHNQHEPESQQEHQKQKQQQQQRRPPSHSVAIHNLSDRQYCMVWGVEVCEDGYRPDMARTLLARVARHINPILRDRGWRVKRLVESASPRFLGCCHTNGRADADAASANIQLNLRVQANKHCRQFRTFSQVLGVMLHEITHISIGLEDIHPPAFWELMDEIKQQYAEKLANGAVAAETEKYGCNNKYVSKDGQVSTIEAAAAATLHGTDTVGGSGGQEEWCGAGKGKRNRRFRGGRGGGGKKRSSAKALGIKATEQQQKRRPLKKGTKMIDKRTKTGKATIATLQSMTSRELAARAALERLGGAGGSSDGGCDAICDPPSTIITGATTGMDSKGSEQHQRHSSSSCSSENEIENDDIDDYNYDDDDDIELIEDHPAACSCRCCEWDKIPAASTKLPVLAQRGANFYD